MNYLCDDIMSTVIMMSVTGTAASLFLFLTKPLIKNRIKKSIQYYLWVFVLVMMTIPFLKLNALFPHITKILPVTAPIYDLANSYQKMMQISPPDSMIRVFFIEWYRSIWLLGASVVFAKNLFGYVKFTQLLKRRNIPVNGNELDLLTKTIGEGKRLPLIYRNLLISTPMLIGIIRPAIIIPDKEYSDIQLKFILLHELTHMRRHDLRVKWLSVLVRAIHWFNPLVYAVCREIDITCELACDESVVYELEASERTDYGNTLIVTASQAVTARSLLSAGMSIEKTILKKRLAFIKDDRKLTRLSGVYTLLLFVITAGVAFVFGTSTSIAAITGVQEESIQVAMNTDNIYINKDFRTDSTVSDILIEPDKPEDSGLILDYDWDERIKEETPNFNKPLIDFIPSIIEPFTYIFIPIEIDGNPPIFVESPLTEETHISRTTEVVANELNTPAPIIND